MIKQIGWRFSAAGKFPDGVRHVCIASNSDTKHFFAVKLASHPCDAFVLLDFEQGVRQPHRRFRQSETENVGRPGMQQPTTKDPSARVERVNRSFQR